MTNLFKKAAAFFGNLTGIKRTGHDEFQQTGIDPAAVITEPSSDAPDSATSFIPLETSDWNDTLSSALNDSEAAVSTGQMSATPFADVSPAPDQPIPAACGLAVEQSSSPIEETVTETPVEEINPPRELKPIPTPKPSVTFTQLYELISNEVNKRTDNAITVYERLLAASRDELNSTRRSNRIAWSIGGVMTAVAAFGAIWSAGEVAATHVELGSLKQQAVAAQHVIVERDQLRVDLMTSKEASAKVEIEALKARLDQALVILDRDHLRNDVLTLRKAKQDIEAELKLVKAAATQPISDARPAASKVSAEKANYKVAGNERPDAWSTLLNGGDDR